MLTRTVGDGSVGGADGFRGKSSVMRSGSDNRTVSDVEMLCFDEVECSCNELTEKDIYSCESPG